MDRPMSEAKQKGDEEEEEEEEGEEEGICTGPSIVI